MSTPTNEELVARWRYEEAPLLPLLHSFHNRDGFLTEEAMRAVSDGLKIPIAEVFGTVTFYHHFAREAPGQSAPRVCTGPVCRLLGSEKLLQNLPEANPMACAGRCDDGVPVIDGHRVLVGTTPESLKQTPSPLPPPNPDGMEECVFAKIREHDRNTLKGYQRTGGYEALLQARAMKPENLLGLITDSQLAGRGGAGFPTGKKWAMVTEAEGEPKSVICNADEGEPGCFKDRAILDYDPHAVIEGMAIAAHATGATKGIIYLRYEYPETSQVVERAISESAELIGDGFTVYLRRGGGAYICGEEGSLINSLEGKHPFPRNRPPFPVTHGYNDLPTVVNNVETLASVAPIVTHGAEWYRNLGRGDHAGTKLISVSGDIQRPGNYEVPFGFPLMELLNDWCGGAPADSSIQAVTMAGLSGGFLAGDDLKVTLDEPSIRAKGSFLGAAGIMVFDNTRNMVDVAHNAMEFFAEESCGKCFPCRIGTQRLTERLHQSTLPESQWREEVQDIGSTMMATSACGLGIAAPNITESLIKYFPDQVATHLKNVD